MLRWFAAAALVGAMVVLPGCSSRSSEIPPKPTSAPAPRPEDAMKKAMQGMPPEMQKKMAPAAPKVGGEPGKQP